MPDALEHLANLTGPSLLDLDLPPSIGLRRATASVAGQWQNPCGFSAPAVEHDSRAQLLHGGIGRHSPHFDFVGLGAAVPRMTHQLCKLAVVGQQQQAFGLEVEATDRVQAVPDRRREQVVHGGAPFRIRLGGHIPGGLVE